MGAQFSKTRSIFLRFFDIFGNAKKTCFHLPLFFMFFTIFGVFLEASGLLLASFWSLCRLFGFLVSSFWVPLARLGCLWARGPLRDCFLLHFRFTLVLFFEQLGGGVLSFFDFSLERCCVRFLFLVRLFGYLS